MKIQATIDTGDGAVQIEWTDGAVTRTTGGPRTEEYVRHLTSGTVSAYDPHRGAYSGFDFTEPTQLRDAIKAARRDGFRAEIALDEVPIQPAPPAGVPLDRERIRALRRGA